MDQTTQDGHGAGVLGDASHRHHRHQVVDQTRITAYDSLVVAAGSGQSYFGNDQFARFAPGMALDQLGEQFSPTLSPRPGQDPRS